MSHVRWWPTMHRADSTGSAARSMYRHRFGAIGMPADGVDHATDLVLRDAYWNPRRSNAPPCGA